MILCFIFNPNLYASSPIVSTSPLHIRQLAIQNASSRYSARLCFPFLWWMQTDFSVQPFSFSWQNGCFAKKIFRFGA